MDLTPKDSSQLNKVTKSLEITNKLLRQINNKDLVSSNWSFWNSLSIEWKIILYEAVNPLHNVFFQYTGFSPRISDYQYDYEFDYKERVTSLEGTYKPEVIKWLDSISYAEIETILNLEYLYYHEQDFYFNYLYESNPLAYLKKLKKLTIIGASFDEISFVSSLEKLNFLSLRYNNIVDLSPLYNLTNLRYLEISNNPVSNYEISKLKEKLPYLLIEY
jgi:hypothetical protein